jgi:hypothetical protein
MLATAIHHRTPLSPTCILNHAPRTSVPTLSSTYSSATSYGTARTISNPRCRIWDRHAASRWVIGPFISQLQHRNGSRPTIVPGLREFNVIWRLALSGLFWNWERGEEVAQQRYITRLSSRAARSTSSNANYHPCQSTL